MTTTTYDPIALSAKVFDLSTKMVTTFDINATAWLMLEKDGYILDVAGNLVVFKKPQSEIYSENKWNLLEEVVMLAIDVYYHDCGFIGSADATLSVKWWVLHGNFLVKMVILTLASKRTKPSAVRLAALNHILVRYVSEEVRNMITFDASRIDSINRILG